MSLEQMLAFLLDKNPHWSDNFIDSLMKNPAKLVAVYTKELEEHKKKSGYVRTTLPYFYSTINYSRLSWFSWIKRASGLVLNWGLVPQQYLLNKLY